MATSGSRKAFDTARKLAEVDYRIYDARHTFVTPLAENPAVSEETIRQLAGHVNPRCSHATPTSAPKRAGPPSQR